jgi:hypothetical protein
LRDGGFLAVGFLGRDDDAPRASDWRALATKLTAQGEVLWRREHGAGGGALARAADGGYVLAGHTESFGAGKRDVWLLKIDAGGVEQWRRTHGGPDDEGALYLEATSDDGFVVSGGVSRDGSSDILVLKVDKEGRELWRRTLGEPSSNDINHGLMSYPDGRVLVTGYTQSWGSKEHDVFAAVVGPDGAVRRVDVNGGAGDDRAMTASLDVSGRAWLVGYTRSAGAGGWDVMVTDYDAAEGFGDRFATFGGPQDDHGTAIEPLSDGTFLISGYSRGLATGSEDAFVMRVAAFRRGTAAAELNKRRVK